ncbi:hypothetical protein GCM10007989_19930 [Devosia pacifica]|uniref:Uncharacterized protein n=1 Tax=Devosia pacifica TaxID=1335967 RepID=A0A918S4N7_9HYPH|nr:hypothetical protein [Devosia pacifica]GHA24275.1 hypothetical protein GCM10007989_19930 [Devosia pacifica]
MEFNSTRHTRTLVNHRDIQNWVADRKGTPAIARVRDRFGSQRSKLCLKFGQTPIKRQVNVDDGMSPCSWTVWLAELDRQNLALEITPGSDGNYQFVERSRLN